MSPAAPETIATLLWSAAERDPTAVALVDGSDTVSYGALASRAAAIASALRDLGISPGDRVAIFLERSPDAVACIFGVLAAGAVSIVINERQRPRHIEFVLGNSGAGMLISATDMLTRQPRALETATRVVDVAGIPSDGELEPVPRGPGDPAVIIYTSGTTGLPKGVTHTQGNLSIGIATCVRYLGLRPDDRTASLLSLSTVYGLNQLLSSVTVGGTLLLQRSPLAAQIVADLRSQEVTVMAGVPPLWLQLLAVPDFRARPIPTLRQMQNAGGHLPAEAARRLRKAQPQADLILQYGMTEVIRTTFLPPNEVDRRPDCMGKPMPGIEVLVVRDDGTPCDIGEVGELVHCGPTVAAGYWGDPEATARVFRPHPVRPDSGQRAVFSGDMVRWDKDGFLYFVSRRDRMIKSMGYRVGPDEIGDVLHASGEILETVVASEPDPERGERIVAWVVLRPGGSVQRLTRFCRAELPPYMQPTRIEAREHLPRLPSGKYDLPALLGQAASR
jgi:amino acid adenylation domain-containing protein